MNFKLALAAVAVVGLAGTAQAADLAKKAPAAANYVKVCDAYGAGFFYIPGSDTCLKIGGFVRAEYRVWTHDRDWGGAYGWTTRDQHGISTRARADFNFDARTNTEMGLLRSYIDVWMTADSAGNGTLNGATPITSLRKAFVQFGGLTAGRATSFFDFYTGTTFGSVYETANSDVNINLLGYTFAFGNGITASLSIEDPSSSDNGRRHTAAGFTDTNYAGVKYPDLVANVNVAQAWGSAQVMGALRHNYMSVLNGGVDDGKLGYAIGGGVKVNLPMLGAGDYIGLQAAYAKGAIDYVSPSWSPLVADQYLFGGSLKQATAWGVSGGLTHNWTSAVATSLGASYAKYEMGNGGFRDVAQIDVQGNVVWTPVKGLALSAELEYRNLDYRFAANHADTDALVGLLRVQRNF